MPNPSNSDLVGEAFRIDVPEIDCWVRFDSRCEYRGVVTTGYTGERSIVLREYDERVLLHEVLHRIIQTAPPEQRPVGWPENIEPEEQLVQRLERGLWAMGWRLDALRLLPELAQRRANRARVPSWQKEGGAG